MNRAAPILDPDSISPNMDIICIDIFIFELNDFELAIKKDMALIRPSPLALENSPLYREI